jgi:signal transduction histidine kinase
LRELVTDVLRPWMLQARLRAISIREEVSPEIVASVDRDLFSRVLENLVDNSLRHAGSGGSVELSGRLGGSVQLRIGNTGQPIPHEYRSRLFEKFAKGTDGRFNFGLGLYFCRIAVEAHQGRIWVEEAANLPTVFSIELPCA